jgi:hypothetical protein
MSQHLNKHTEVSFVRRNTRLFLIIFLILAAHQTRGILPVAPIEGDGLAMANGATLTASIGLGPNPLVYRYADRSGTYAFIAALHKLTGIKAYMLFSLVSGLSSVIFVLFSALLIREITDYPFATSGLVVLLFPQSFVGGYYANNTVVVAAIATPAMYLLKKSQRPHTQVFAGVLLGMAAWIRFDVALLAPACLLLLHENNWKQTAFRALVVGSTAAVVCALAMYLSGSSISKIYGHLMAHRSYGLAKTGEFLRCHLSFFSALLLGLFIVGLIYLVRRRNWYLLATFLAAVIPLYVVLGKSLINPRFLYYYVPFFSIPIVYALSQIEVANRCTRLSYVFIILILFIMQYAVGWKSTSKSTLQARVRRLPHLVIDNPINPSKQVEAKLGVGGKLRLPAPRQFSSGLLYVAVSWRNWKSRVNSNLRKLHSYLDNREGQSLNFLTYGWERHQHTLHVLLHRGYTFQLRVGDRETELRRYIFKKEDREAVVTWLPYDDPEAGLSLISTPGAILVTHNKNLLDLYRRHAKRLNEICYYVYELTPPP